MKIRNMIISAIDGLRTYNVTQPKKNVQKTLITKLMKTRAVPIPLLRFSLVFKFIVASKTEHENNLHLVKT